MRYKQWTDFLFLGLGVLPAALLIGGRPDVGILVFFPLLFAAAFCSRFEQLESGMPADAVAIEGTEKPAGERRRLAREESIELIEHAIESGEKMSLSVSTCKTVTP